MPISTLRADKPYPGQSQQRPKRIEYPYTYSLLFALLTSEVLSYLLVVVTSLSTPTFSWLNTNTISAVVAQLLLILLIMIGLFLCENVFARWQKLKQKMPQEEAKIVRKLFRWLCAFSCMFTIVLFIVDAIQHVHSWQLSIVTLCIILILVSFWSRLRPLLRRKSAVGTTRANFALYMQTKKVEEQETDTPAISQNIAQETPQTSPISEVVAGGQ